MNRPNREEFLKWLATNKTPPSYEMVYDYLCPPQSEDVKKRAAGFANRVVHLWRINNYTPNQTIDKRDWARLEEIISSEFKHALLSFNPSVQMPSDEECEDAYYSWEKTQNAIHLANCPSDVMRWFRDWIRDRIEKGQK